MISLKKYLDMDPTKEPSKEPSKEPRKETAKPSSGVPLLNELSSVILESYRSALLAMGKSGIRACPDRKSVV